MSAKAVKSYQKPASPLRAAGVLASEPIRSAAARAVIEHLEGRQLMAADPFANENDVQGVPFVLDFDGSSTNGLHDKDGEHIGFTRVQVNNNGRDPSYVASLIDQVNGTLRITTSGNATAGTNFNNDNTLTNAVETTFNGSSSGFVIQARLIGPMSYINEPSEQAGISFGPGQDNYVKLVAVSRPEGTRLQFVDEELVSGTTFNHVLDATRDIGSFSSVNSLDLRLVGDAATGKVRALFSVNGGAFQAFTQELTLTGTRRAAFFSTTARAGLVAAHKNNTGAITAVYDRFEIQPGTPVTGRPSVAEVNPRHQATNVLRDQFVSAQLNLTGGGIDSATLTDATVRLYRTSDRRVIDASVGTSGAGDVIILTPNELLEKNTNYTFEVTDGLHDVAGNAFVAFSSTFTTGTTGGEIDPSFSFEKVDLPNAKGEEFTALAVGPDGKLYAGTVDGRIFRYVINSNGTLGSSQELKVVQNANGGNKRLLTGLAFQPGSTAANPILWVTHGQYRFGLKPDGSMGDEQRYADDWTGKISKITNLGGSNTGNLVDIVTGLPRSVRDHLTNQPSFGPDGALYIPQGSNSAGGAPDVGWGNRPERKLSGAVLRLAPAAFTRTTPLNVKTEDGGSYDPFATGAQLTIYATGVRNAYDLVWTDDGHLYAPTNGTAKGANTPGTSGVPALNDIPAQHDFLFRITQGGYYGHPNPTRSEYIFGAGYTPADGVGPQELPQYGGTINPDSDYRGFAYDFDLNISPNGILEYKNASAFGGRLQGKMIVARYSGPNDLMILTKDASGAITQAQKGIAGFGQLEDPLDIVENPANGFLYVSEYSERDPLKRKITLLRPIAAGATATPNKPRLVFTDIQNASTGGTAATAAQTVTIRNTGTQPLTIPAGGVTIIDDPDPSTPGNDASQFEFVNLPTLPATVAVGETITFQVRFKAASTGLKGAFLRVQSNATNNPDLRVALRGIGTTSDSSGDVGGAHEASLQRILDAFQIPVNVGDSNGADTYDLPTPRPAGTLHDEIEMQRLVKAGAGPVVIEPLAEYAFNTRAGSVAHLGYYSPGTKDAKTEVTRVDWTERTSTNPTWGGSFDPGTSPFALYGEFPSGSHSALFEINGLPRGVYSEDVFNTWDSVNKKKVRFFPLKNADGTEVSNAYVFAFEEFSSGYDSNDVVGIIRNVRPAATGPEIGTQNVDRQPSTEAGGTAARALNPTRLSFNRIQIQPPDPVRNENGTFTQPPNNVVHDQAKLRIRNSGDQPLTINSLVLSNTTHFQLVSPPAAGTVIAAGGFLDVTVKFIATSGRIKTGTLTINSNDADESATTIDLVGYWQSKSENNEEPTMPEFMQLFGYGTQMTYPGEQLSLPTDPGKVRRTGDEVLSAFWRRANPAAAVEVIQLAAFHSQGNVAVAKWHYASSFTTSNIFTHDGEDGQSLLPRLEPNGLLAANTFKPTTQGTDTNPAFGFRFDNEWSDPSRNPQEKPGGGYGHHVRFWVAKDLAGNVIPNTYIVGMDYSGINYDYQDNLYLVRNIKPVSAPSAPTGATATASGGGIALNWGDNAEANLAGYNVYRGTTAGFTPGSANRLNTTGLLTSSDYNDIFAPTGATSFYKISAVDASGNESGFTSVSATRSADTTPPAAPANLNIMGSETAITLDWDNNTESDLAGYDVLRSTSAGGTYTKLNTDLLTTSSYVDSTAATGVTYFYQVVAKDQSGNTSAPATGSGQRGQVTTPNAPANLDAVAASSTQVNLSWSASAGAASYRIERRIVGAPTFDEIATSVLTTSFQDTGRTPETAYEYRVRAENSAGISGYSNTDTATTSATPTTAYTGVDVGGAAPAGSSTSSNNDTSFDITGGGPNIYGNADGFYFVYRSVTGDFDFKARVASLGSLNSSTKGGLMARATTAGGSTNVFAQVSQINGYRLSRRATDGASTSLISGGGAVSYPNTWVRLQRVGNTFTAYKSTDGTNWTPYASATQTMPTTLLLGMAVTSGTTSATVSGEFRDVGDTNPTTPAPGVPGNLQADGSSTTTVDLTWQAGANAASYRVERKGPGDADFVEIAANVTATTYQDTGRTPNTTYEYRVRSVGASGTVFSAYSNVDPATTLPDTVTPPAIPANLDAVAFSPTQVNLSWGASSGATSYRIERRILGAASFDEIASGVTTTSYQDTGRVPETTYEYRVRAENAGGMSDYSNTDSATTPADTTPTNPVTLRAGADAYVRDGSFASQNFGQATELHLRQTSSAGMTREFFLKFDLSGVASVASAKLRLNGVIHHATQSAQVAVFAVSNTTWAEGSITWNNRPASTGAALATQTVAGAAKFYEWDVTQYLAAEKAAGRNVVTLVVRSLTTTDPYMIFQSDEAAANQPQLVVTPQGGNPNPTPAPGQPQGLQATAPSSTQVSLAWQAVSGATHYRVERKGPGDADFVEIAGNVTTTGYQDAGRAPQTLYEYRVRAENAGGLSPYSVVASVTTPAAPVAGYTFTDVGATSPTGSTVAADGDTSFALTGGGPNIYGTTDGFHFAHRAVTGDFDVKARLESIGSLNNSTKGGLMARATLDGNSANVFAQLSQINGYRLSRRATAGGATDIVNSNAGISTPNAWVRLRRVGNTFTAFRSTDGVNWVTIGAYTQTMPATLYLGMALTSGTTSATVSAQFRDVGNV